jgi:KaiC/GvpD/RAD55 family RecA-like ATPase
VALVRSCPIIRYTDHIREEKRNALYVSFSESKEQFNDNTGRLGMDFTGHEKNGDFVYLDFASITREGMRDALDEILATIRERNVRRIVADSFSAIAQANDTIIDARIVLQTILGKMMRSEGVTTFLIAEVPFGQSNIGTGIDEFVADGIIHLSHGSDNASPILLSVVKMRGTSINREPHVYTIGRNGGTVYPYKASNSHTNHQGQEFPQAFQTLIREYPEDCSEEQLQHCLVQPESAKLVLLSNSLQKGSEMGNQGYTFHWKSQATTPIDFIQPASMKS